MSTPQNSVWTLPKPQIGPQNQVDFKLDMKGALKMNIVQLYKLTPKKEASSGSDFEHGSSSEWVQCKHYARIANFSRGRDF